MLTDSTFETLVACLTAVRDEDRPKAAVLAGQAAEAGSRLGAALARHLGSATGGHVYDQPAAFTAFIRGGGNVHLYDQLARRLAAVYDDRRPASLLDLGCGDGLALVPALDLAAHRPSRIDLVEPSAALLETARERVTGDGVHAEQTTAQEFLAATEASWDLVQSTFALQSLEPDDRLAVFGALHDRTGELVLAEFDVPDVTEGSPEHLASLAARYERGVAEYDDELVAQGFLMPMLLGLVSPDGARNNWEQPAGDWVKQLTEAGFGDVEVTPLADYWWSPAVVIRATTR
ncbi:class I SAM-dependent methyltransferase [Amycolatopsis magusensis]|uniref:SAM-dependent methyltransferase n=1 Tax=Amycolatopsis magusensis TaxID=882444 RepID=A0ABS4PK17_9PSEU|nr:class I SAM-dependent methyltransferase [Amycolatopsis magusensis]MBP2179760.1 SAM-dependent methyltransferase [Amycolatopsis magusensis]